MLYKSDQVLAGKYAVAPNYCSSFQLAVELQHAQLATEESMYACQQNMAILYLALFHFRYVIKNMGQTRSRKLVDPNLI